MAAAPTKVKILIAEDNPQGAELLEAYLADLDCETRLATDGLETLRLVEEWQPDLVLLDIMMPRVSGFEVCKRLRHNPQTQHIPIVMITALDQPSDIERAVEAGTDDFLTKPIHKKELLVRIRALLDSRHEKRPLDRALAYFREVDRYRQSAA
ncbi:MAG: response regulator [Gemmatales bacterium]|nr:response regulator [Gemmatales bacterium]MCS7160469.1 response regulator [Gemmatales bacterium]MDW8175669.1 response regulator [Gemmatales bacterium]MDW8222994.1 response regulator [Gemmatales bacterium]